MKRIICMLVLLMLCFNKVFAQDFYVRPSGGNYGMEDGTSYANAWDGLSNVNWSTVDSGNGKLFVCGTHREEMTITVSGENGTPIHVIGCEIVNGASTDDPALILGSDEFNTTEDWTDDPSLGTNQWRTSSGTAPELVGLLMFTSEAQGNTGNNEKNQIDVDADMDFYYDTTNEWVVVYTATDANPATYYSDIEIGVRLYGITATSKDYITIEDIEIKYPSNIAVRTFSDCTNIIVDNVVASYGGGKYQETGEQSGNGIDFSNGATNSIIRNCIVSQWWDWGYAVEHWAAGTAYTSQNVTLTNNIASKCGGGITIAHAGTVASGSSISDITVSNNTITDIGYGWSGYTGNVKGRGIGCLEQDNHTLTDITINNNVINSFAGVGIRLQEGEFTVYNNIISNGTGDEGSTDNVAILLSGGSTGESVREISGTISYNIIDSCKGGLRIVNNTPRAPLKLNIYNNTIYASGGGEDAYPGIWIAGGSNRNNLSNNIIYAKSDSLAMNAESGVFLKADHNIYYKTSGEIIRYGGAHYTSATFGKYQTAISGETNSRVADPLFVSVSDRNFRIQSNSPCKDRGFEIAGFGMDYAGVPVPQGDGVDIGAFEYVDTLFSAGTVIINNGDAVTYTPTVFLSLSVTDEEINSNGLMTFSNDNQVWSNTEPYASGKIWTLSSGEGEKTVYVKYSDAAGNWMGEPAQDQIIYQETKNTCDDPQKILPVSIAVSNISPFSVPENVFDGNFKTKWSTLSFFSKEQFLTLDLGERKILSGLTMYASKLFGTDFFPTDFQVQISRDNSAWAEITSEKGYTLPLQSPNNDNWIFEDLECRYLRINITKSKTLFLLFHLTQIAEIEVYGCTATQYVPLVSEEDSLGKVKNQEDKKQIETNVMQNHYQEPPSTPGTPVVDFFN